MGRHRSVRTCRSDVVRTRRTAQWERLAARGIGVVDGEVAGLTVEQDRLTGVTVAATHGTGTGVVPGTRIPVAAPAVAPRFVARGELLASLGLVPVEHPRGMGTYVASDASGRTEAPGVWVAGNVTDLTAAVPVAQAAGMTAATAINADLVDADTDAAVARRATLRRGVDRAA